MSTTQVVPLNYWPDTPCAKAFWRQPELPAYRPLLAHPDVCRVLRPGGYFVFSVNVPEPSWLRVALSGVWGILRSAHPLNYLKNAYRMWTYGGWLKRQARSGRFHYLSAQAVRAKLIDAGF